MGTILKIYDIIIQGGIMSKIILIYLIIINIITFLIFGLDKLFAILKKSRVSEKTLLFLSIIGGCFLELFGMYLFNHKIRKSKRKDSMWR